MTRRLALPLLAAALVAACATTTPPRQSAEAAWTSGRLSVRIDASAAQPAQSVSAAFELQGSGDSGELRLNSPLGTRVASARWTPGLAVLADSDGERRYGSLDDLSRRALGEALPLVALPDWLAGRPWPGGAVPSQRRRLRSIGLAGAAQQAWRGLGRGATCNATGSAGARQARRAWLSQTQQARAMALQALYDVPAPAKLNLFLHVVGRRADGYHLLQTPMVLIDWADTLHFERRADGALQRHDLAAALPADDLCLRAARALQAASGSAWGVDVSIVKRVPAGAGMGGGSSDAGTTLLALNRLWQLNWPRSRLAALALQLGADVPFFVGGCNAFAEGIGEQLTPITFPPAAFAVLKPPVALATQEIFSHPLLVRDTLPVIVAGSFEDAGRSGFAVGLQQCWDPANVDAAFGRNDLQAPAEDRCPEVAQAARLLAARYGNSRMTGSGSAVFARVAMDGMAEVTRKTALEDVPHAWVARMCRSLPAHPLVAWAD